MPAEVQDRGPVRIEIARYYDKECLRRQNLTLDQALDLCDGVPGGGVTWFNVDGVHDAGVVEAVGERFKMHPLVIEDVMHTTQRPKVETYGDQIYVVVRTLSIAKTTDETTGETTDESAGEMAVEQSSFVLGSDWLVLFQERPGDVFGSVRQRIDTAATRLRQRGADYLLYSFLDAIVDSYFGLLEQLGDRIEEVEDALIDASDEDYLSMVHELRKQLLVVRRTIWPLRDVFAILQHTESKLIAKDTRLYLRDVYDHTVRLIDTVETYRETLASIYDLAMSTVSNRMNAVMKVLTIISTIFIPLTFISGVYGMNFHHMPEIDAAWGYPAVLLLMALVAIGMLIFFKRRKWL